jgi:hypothetical protein
MLWLSHTLCNSLQHALSLFSLLWLHQSLLSIGFQCRKFPLLRVPELYQRLSYRLLTVTAHNDWTAVFWITHQPTLHFHALHCLLIIVLLITFWHGLHRKHQSSIAVQLLLSKPHRKHRFPVSPLVHARNLLPSCRHCLQSHYLATGLHATILWRVDPLLGNDHETND